MLARPLSRRISTIFLRSWAHATGRMLLYWHTSLAWYRKKHLYFIRICSQGYNISRQEAMLAPIRLTNAGSCPSRQRDCVAEPIRLANAAAPLLLRSQARRKAYRARSAETKGTAQLPCGSGETQGEASPLHSTPPLRGSGRTSVLVHSGGFAAALVRQEYIQGIVYGDDAFEHTLRIDHRYSQQVILRHDLGNFAWFRIRLYSNQVGLHEFLQGLLRRGY